MLLFRDDLGLAKKTSGKRSFNCTKENDNKLDLLLSYRTGALYQVCFCPQEQRQAINTLDVQIW